MIFGKLYVLDYPTRGNMDTGKAQSGIPHFNKTDYLTRRRCTTECTINPVMEQMYRHGQVHRIMPKCRKDMIIVEGRATKS
jgi:hypothetical protein